MGDKQLARHQSDLREVHKTLSRIIKKLSVDRRASLVKERLIIANDLITYADGGIDDLYSE